MGMEHERIHLETSSVLIRQLPVDMVCKPKGWTYAPIQNGKLLQQKEFYAYEITCNKYLLLFECI